MEKILLSSFIIISLISGTYFFIDEYKRNKKLRNDNPWKDDIFTIFLESYTMGGVVVGFVSTIIIGIILITVNSL